MPRAKRPVPPACRILGGQRPLPRTCVRRAVRELLVALLLYGGSWRLFTQMSPFHSCLPSMDRPNYGAGEIRQHFNRLRVFTLKSWETEVTVERQDSLDEYAVDKRTAPETARFRRWMSPEYSRCATPLKTHSASRLFFSP